MSLDDRDWYREAIRERDAKRNSKVVDFKKSSKRYSRGKNVTLAKSTVNARGGCGQKPGLS